MDISAALCGGIRDPTEEATVKGSIKDDNRIRCEKDNAKLLERTRCLSGKGKQASRDLLRSLPVRSTQSARRCRGFPSRSILDFVRNDRKRETKCSLDFAAQDFSFSGRYACPKTNFQRKNWRGSGL